MAQRLNFSQAKSGQKSSLPKFGRLTNSDLVAYAKFIEWQLIILPETELEFWEREAEAVTIEARFRQSKRKLAQALAEMKR